MPKNDRILEILGEAKKLAQEYRQLTGKPLGITGEAAEYEAARILGIQLTPARQAGYDAIEDRVLPANQRAMPFARFEAWTAAWRY